MSVIVKRTVFTLMLCVISSWSSGQSPLDDTKVEVLKFSHELDDIMRHDVKDVRVDEKYYTDIELPHTVTGRGAVIPIVIEGRGGGNTSQIYAALFEIQKPDLTLLHDFGDHKNDHSHAALLAYDQIDTLRWRSIDWEGRTTNRNRITIQACELAYTIASCPFETRGKIVIDVDGTPIGPNLQIINEPR